MTRFILVTFAFLGWAFYEASGGADYAPRPQFAQRDADPALIAPPAQAPDIEVTRLAVIDTTSVAPIEASSVTDNTALEAAVLAAIQTSDVATPTPPQPEIQEQRVKVTFAVKDPVVTETGVGDPIVSETDTAEPEDTAPLLDLRAVAGSRVNLRDGPGQEFGVVSRLNKGTSVMVLEDPGDGWVQLQVVPGGSIGWMADWLLTKDG